MKKIILFFIIILPFAAISQIRYIDPIFNVTVTSDILYGNNTTWDGTSQDLLLDIYEPEGDELTHRPIIIFAHGGSFLAGSKENASMVALCTAFAKMGYVTASINYRLGVDYYNVIGGNGETEFVYASLRGTHDMRAAIRFFRKDAYQDNLFKIDTNYIIGGGSSAGGFMALHTAYLDKLSEIPEQITNIEELGGIEGNSGNQGYLSTIKCAINLCGAIGDTAWIEPGNTPLISMHGDEDGTVPYGTGNVELFGIPVYEVQGSEPINQRCNNINIYNNFHTFIGQDHVPYDPLVGAPEHELFMDTTISFIKYSIYNQFFGTITSSQQTTFSDITIFPNPSSGNFTISNNNQFNSYSIYNLNGIEIETKKIKKGNSINTKLQKGLYIVVLKNND
ncbi:MAG: T9SS type A sorting domain-containing protein, partial [Bacteroidota bacterium]|nr:T9SS type A sorting domain-containing protein [Bacteroidota bacterium]